MLCFLCIWRDLNKRVFAVKKAVLLSLRYLLEDQTRGK